MISKGHIAFHARQCALGVSVAGGAVVTAAMIAAGIARADEPTPADLLDSAHTNLMAANQVLSQIDVPVQPPGAIALQMTQQDLALYNLGQLESAQDVISSHDGAFSGIINQLFFTPLDQGWVNASESVLNADQALSAAIASGSGLEAAEFGLFSPDFQLLSDALNSIPLEEVALLF